MKLNNLISLILVAVLLAFTCSCASTNSNSNKSVILGIDNIDNNLDLFKDKNVGLITNATGVNSSFESTIDILNNKVNITALFAPEHGIRGSAAAGDKITDEFDQKTGLQVFSLYGENKKPSSQMLSNVDVLVYDIQDVGCRFYTYISTMKYAMQAARECNKTFVVLDRPNPVSSNVVQGDVLEESFESFVGITKIPQRYGMTCGEIAQFMNTEDNINCDLKVVKMSNYSRNEYYNETGLNVWILPSPNMPNVNTALVYSGTCLIEGTNLSEGRGTTKPFELIGAPYVNSIELADKLNGIGLKGVFFRATSFTPTASKFKDQKCNGIELHVYNKDSFDAVKTGVAVIYTIRDMYPNDFKYLETNMIDKLAGNNYIRLGNYSLDEIFNKFDESSSNFKKLSSKYYLYS